MAAPAQRAEIRTHQRPARGAETGCEPKHHGRVGCCHRAQPGHHGGDATVCRCGQRLPRNLSGTAAMLAGASSQLSGLAFAAIVLVTSTALVAGLAWVSRRLLGLPVGALRALIAGVLGFIAAELLGRSLRAAQPRSEEH